VSSFSGAFGLDLKLTGDHPRSRPDTADEELNEISEEKWTAKGDVQALVKSFSTFAPEWQKLLS
jgi:hypothetical protein